MAVKYASGGLIVEQLKNIDSNLSTLPHTILDGIVEQVEGEIDSIMRTSNITFDASKHGLLRSATVALATVRALAYEPGGTSSTAEASLIADIMWATWMDCKALLEDQKVVDYMKGL